VAVSDSDITGTDSSDKLIGGAGADSLYGGAGNDFLNGGSGSDVLDGGSGIDTVLGGSGSDLLIFRAWENQWKSSDSVYNASGYVGTSFTSYDSYDGGSGAVKGQVVGTTDVDTLAIFLSNAQMSDAAFMAALDADVKALRAFIAANTNQNTGQAGPAEFTMTSINLKVSAIELVTVALDPKSPVARADCGLAKEAGGVVNSTGGQDGTGNVLVNDTDPLDPTPVLRVVKVQDANDNLAVALGTTSTTGTSITGLYGTLKIGADGSYSYVVNNSNPAVDALDDGGSLSDVFTYTVLDEDGLTASATLTIKISGTDDAPTLDAVTAGTIAEVTQSAATTPSGLTGKLQGHDVDAGETLTYGIENGTAAAGTEVMLAGSFGTLYVDTVTGAYRYVPDAAAIEALDDDDQKTDSFTVTVWDGDGNPVSQTFAVNITGADDAPVLDVDGVASYSLGGPAVAVDPSITITDVDSQTLSGATVQITANRQSGDVLNFSSQSGITGSYNDTTGLLTLMGAATLAQYEAALESITFGSTSSSTLSRTISFQVTDSAGATSAADTALVNVSGQVDTQGPTDLRFSPDLTNLGTLESGSSLNAGASMGKFLALNDPNSSTFTYALGGANASLFSLDAGTGQLRVGASAVAANGPNSSYAITVTAFDQANNSSGPIAFNIWVGGTSADTFAFAGANDFIGYGLNGGDSITGSSGDDFIAGGGASDKIFGLTGDDTLAGGDLGDTLSGGAGNNVLYGGNGNDTFIFTNLAATSNHVMDYAANLSGNNHEVLTFDVGLLANEFSAGDNDTLVENFVIGNDAAINVAGTEMAVRTTSVTNGTVQSVINGYTNITTGAFFVFLNSDLGHVAVYYDPKPSVAGGAVLVAELDTVTALTGFDAADFMFI
jgi:VCBS repeat-containing protein